MNKVSELLSKQLICLQTAGVVGTVSNILLDEKLQKCLLLKIYCENDDDALNKYVKLGDVKSAEGDAVVVLSPESVLNEWESPASGYNPINSRAYNQDGKELGRVNDIVLDGAKVTAIVVGETEYLPANVLSHSEKLLIFNDSGKPVRFPRPAFKAEQNVKAEVHQTETSAQTAEQDGTDSAKQKGNITVSATEKVIMPVTLTSGPAPIPTEIIAKYDFLLNKTVQKNLFADDGAQLARQGEIITFEVITAAKQKGKLVQLAINAI